MFQAFQVEASHAHACTVCALGRLSTEIPIPPISVRMREEALQSEQYRKMTVLIHAMPRCGDPVSVQDGSSATMRAGKPEERRPSNGHLEAMTNIGIRKHTRCQK